MIRYFTSRELSKRLVINLARWKRWAREFLPPDPLGGLQSGYARQYSINDALKVFLGGHLVSELKYSIPEARKIVAELTHWGEQAGLFINSTQKKMYRHPRFSSVGDWSLRITQSGSTASDSVDFRYTLIGLIEEKILASGDPPIKEVRYYEIPLESASNATAAEFSDPLRSRSLKIKALLERFVDRLNLDRTDFPILAAATAPDRQPAG